MLTAEMVKESADRVELLIRNALPEIIDEVKQEILEQKKKSFMNKGANDWDSSPFPELEKSTIKRKQSYSHPDYPLVRTGDLEESLYVNESLNDFDVYSELPYVDRVKEWESEKGTSHPFGELTDQEYDMVLKKIEERLQNAFDQ